MKIISWNINGIRSAYSKGDFSRLLKLEADIIALQEIKSDIKSLPKNLLSVKNYHSYFAPSERKGYSGVAIYSKKKPINIKIGFGIKKFDTEGRIIEMEFKDFILLNIYFPNGKRNSQRLSYKLDFYEFFIDYINKSVKQGKNVIAVGDFNTAHKEIDLARPKENEKISGFLKVERDLLDRIVEDGFIDVFRHFNKEKDHYTWWSQRTKARERNVGWRIDYAFTNKGFLENIKSLQHLDKFQGSDHCPLLLEIKTKR